MSLDSFMSLFDSLMDRDHATNMFYCVFSDPSL